MGQLLIEKGADLNEKDYSGETALHQASKGVHREIVKLLIEEGANIKAKDNSGETALHQASNRLKTAELLIEKGADINAKDNSGKTALHKASGYGYTITVLYLIENGADVNTKDESGETALDSASKGGHSEIVKLLIEKGAEGSVCNRCGKPVFRQSQFLNECRNAGLVIIDGNLYGGFKDGGKVEIYRKLENRKGFRCASCSKIYCMSCLSDFAPVHKNGGKACFKCRGSFVKYE